MHELRFSTPLIAYLETGEDQRIREEIRSFLPDEHTS
jgi:hypothetical protein